MELPNRHTSNDIEETVVVTIYVEYRRKKKKKNDNEHGHCAKVSCLEKKGIHRNMIKKEEKNMLIYDTE
jgi:hypothetical protein